MASESSRSANKTKSTPPMRLLLRFGGIALAAGVVLSGCIYASQSFERFLIRDPRFFLPGPADYGLESPNLELHGVKYASRHQILRFFDADYGRSLYLFPLSERRKQLLGVRWVHDASIARIWPNRIIVDINERKPAAFIKLPAESMVRWALIDEEGVILDPPARATFQLPVLAGSMGGLSQEKRGTRVRRMKRLMKELGPLADNVSEVDATDLDDLKVTEIAGGSAVFLMLGDRNFSSRLRNFLDHYPDIHRRMPQAVSFDLRLDDRITGLESSRDGK
ncbi:MAG TPA: FtsQ-type POTRA domain-containing protein [Bryobacteraceae bacterium]|nr:FtsQ-type POTRA domain-containing protein [Bryobacteraceae bacterium]